MLESRLIEWINADLDGELAPDEQCELNRALEASPKAAAYRDDLARLNELLQQAPGVRPPEHLAGDILRRVELPSRRPGFNWLGFVQRPAPAAAAVAFASGLVVAVGIHELGPRQQSQTEIARMFGAMVGHEGLEKAPIGDRFPIEAEGFDGSVSLKSGPDLQMLQFDLDSKEAIEIAVDYQRAGMKFGGLVLSAEDPENGLDSFDISGGAVRLVNRGRHRFAIFLRELDDREGTEQRIIIAFTRDGRSIYRGVLETRQ